MSQQDKPCTTHHHACACREEGVQKLEAALEDAVKALEFYCQKRDDVKEIKQRSDYEFYPNEDVAVETIERVRKAMG